MLHKIVERKKESVQALRKQTSVEQLKEKMQQTVLPARSMKASIADSPRSVSVIAEVKKASPSRGVIREDFHPEEIAEAYASAEVEGISVLTDKPFFQGKNEYLTQVKDRVCCPVLRKDFIIDPIQIYESRVIGADCILLIAAILTEDELAAYHSLAKSCGLDTLIEVHTEEEIRRVLRAVAHPDLIGINNRDLTTFTTSLETTERLMPLIPSDIPVISESGIHSPEDIRDLRKLGVRGVLVGEHFMRQENIAEAVFTLVGSAKQSERQ